MKKWLIIAGVIAFAVVFSWKYIDINNKYPDPEIVQAKLGETLHMGSYHVTLSDVERYGGEYLRELMPRRAGSADIAVEDEYIVLVGITIKHAGNNATFLDLSEIAVESGAWHNHFDMEVFSVLNPDISMELHISDGDSKYFIIPVIMHRSGFPESEWVDVADRPISVVLGCYPAKYVLVC